MGSQRKQRNVSKKRGQARPAMPVPSELAWTGMDWHYANWRHTLEISSGDMDCRHSVMENWGIE